MDQTELYRAFRDKGKTAYVLLMQTHWFLANAEFDPKTGEALPQALSTFLAKVARMTGDRTIRDRLWRITEHSRASVERLFRALNESPRREQAMLPVRAVRELDANSFIKLSNRPGRNIREKLAEKPYLQAVRRFQSVNLPENRLLKAFVIRLEELLKLRRDCLEQEDELLPKIKLWLRSDEAHVIGNWDNLPPNNTLLAHRDYRRVWDAWRWLQTLDDDIVSDWAQRKVREKTVRDWMEYVRKWKDGKHLFADMPLLFDYEKFEILPWSSPPPLFMMSEQSKSREVQHAQKIFQPVCLDLTCLRPCYAVTTRAELLPDAFLWQQWKNDNDFVDIELFNSDAAYLHSEATSISSSDLFFSKDNSPEHLDRAARAFACKLGGVFKNDSLVWLVPDFLNDFELEITRRNLNARFSNAEPLPRSVAGVFERVDYSRINAGFSIIVIDAIGGNTCVTKLVAELDPELEKRLPETCGLYWERQPSIIVESTAPESAKEKNYDIITVDDKGQWHNATKPVKQQFFEPSSLKSDPRIGNFAFVVNLTNTPVVGGIRLHALQQRAGDIPLWRDQIPELSIKVMKDRLYQRFYLVSRGETVKPIRGKPVPIRVDEEFTLPAGKRFYKFPLFQGESADDLGFEARLESPAFPLKKGAVCKLDLTFEYGADTPYKLVFTPLDKSFPPIRAIWRRTEEVIVTDASAPEYPPPMDWADLRRSPKPNSSETSDLLEWVQTAIERLDQDLYNRPKPRVLGVISSKWRIDKNDKHYTFASFNSPAKSVFIHENSFVPSLNYSDFTEGDSISFELKDKEREGKYSGRKIAGPEYKETDGLKKFDEESTWSLVVNIRRSLYFPVIQVWRDGRSIGDQECQKEFAAAMKTHIAYLTALLRESELHEAIKNTILFLLSCMHKDAPDECVQWITGQANDNIWHKQAVGFALGDVSEQWQKSLLSKLVAHQTNDALRVFAYAIWRERHFVERFNSAELESMLRCLVTMLDAIKPCPQGKQNDWIRTTREPLELLLGLLRARASSNPEIKMLLQPHQKITKTLAKQVERVTEIIARSNSPFFSRVHMNLQKSEGDHTPDLLYALRLYLTGDDGVNTIRISSVSDSDHD